MTVNVCQLQTYLASIDVAHFRLPVSSLASGYLKAILVPSINFENTDRTYVDHPLHRSTVRPVGRTSSNATDSFEDLKNYDAGPMLLSCLIRCEILSARAAMVFEGLAPIASGTMLPSAT